MRSPCSVLSTALEAEETELRGLWDKPELKLNKVCLRFTPFRALPVKSAKTGLFRVLLGTSGSTISKRSVSIVVGPG
jgi:hypothetical protein